MTHRTASSRPSPHRYNARTGPNSTIRCYPWRSMRYPAQRPPSSFQGHPRDGHALPKPDPKLPASSALVQLPRQQAALLSCHCLPHPLPLHQCHWHYSAWMHQPVARLAHSARFDRFSSLHTAMKIRCRVHSAPCFPAAHRRKQPEARPGQWSMQGAERY